MKRENSKVVTQIMVTLQRQEIIIEVPAIDDFMKRWPALFSAAQVSMYRNIRK